MSFYRFCRFAASNSKANFTRPHQFLPVRLQSTQKPKTRVVTRVLIYGVTLTSAAVGGTVAYSNYDPDFRKTVETYIPGFDSFANISTDVWHKGVQFAGEGWQKVKEFVMPERSSGVGIQLGNKDERKVEVKFDDQTSSIDVQPSKEAKGTDISEADETGLQSVSKSTTTSSSADEKQSSPAGVESVNKGEEIGKDSTDQPKEASSVSQHVESRDSGSDIEESSDNVTTSPDSKTNTTNTLDEIESELRKRFEDFIQTSEGFKAALQYLNETITSHHLQLLEANKTPENESDMEKIAGSIAGTEKAMEDAQKQLEKSRNQQSEISEKLVEAVANALKLDICKELAEQIRLKISEFQNEIEKAEEGVKEAIMKRQSSIEDYQEEVKKEKDALLKDLEKPLPELDSQQEALLMMLRRRIENLQEKMKNMEIEEKQKLAEALDNQKRELDNTVQEMIDIALHNQQQDFEHHLQIKEEELAKSHEESLKDQLLQQAQAHSHHLTDSLQKQADELQSLFSEEYKEKLNEKEQGFQFQLAAALSQLKGIHSMINTVAEAGESTRKQQKIHAACDTLTSAILSANTNPDPYVKHSISNEVSSLKDAAKEDEFISTVLSAIPEEALENGISSETGLKSRFKRVRKVCKRVALVPEEGGGLGMHLLSFMQSLLTFDMVYHAMADQKDLKSMNTFELLAQANTYLEQGDLETALRLVNQLTGESRRIASDWVKEACLYLETRQTVMVIAEYLAASSITVIQ